MSAAARGESAMARATARSSRRSITISAATVIGVLQGRERPRRLDPLRAARFESSRAGRAAAQVDVCAAARGALIFGHGDGHAKLPDSRLSEWGSAPIARSLVGRRPLAVERRARNPLRGVSRVRTDAHRDRHFPLADAVEAHLWTRVALAGACDLSDTVLARSGSGVSQLLRPTRPLPALQAQEQLREPALSGRGGRLGSGARQCAEARGPQARRIAARSRTAGPGDALARCRGALLREFLRTSSDRVAADHAARGGCGPGTDPPGNAVERGEDSQSAALSRPAEVPAPAAALSCAATKRQSAARAAARARGPGACPGETAAPVRAARVYDPSGARIRCNLYGGPERQGSGARV